MYLYFLFYYTISIHNLGLVRLNFVISINCLYILTWFGYEHVSLLYYLYMKNCHSLFFVHFLVQVRPATPNDVVYINRVAHGVVVNEPFFEERKIDLSETDGHQFPRWGQNVGHDMTFMYKN